MIEKKMLIGGRRVSGETWIQVKNPVDNQVFARVPSGAEAEVNAAVSAAEQAFAGWSAKTPFDRGALLRKASQNVMERKAEIARLMTMEQGKPLAEAMGEVVKGADILRYYAEEGERVYGRIIPNADGAHIMSQVVYQPAGVVACISPWNYPVELLAWKVAAAMAAGCTCVLKVPSETPLSPIAFAEAIVEAGFEDGVINLVTGPGGKIGDILTAHPKVKKLAFTGSTQVGKAIMKNASSTLKRMSLELGGSLPMIVCEDCDLEAAATGAVRRSFRNMGQICIAINRIYVDHKRYEEFLEKFAEKTKKLTIGNGLTDACDLGPMCTAKGVATTEAHITDALQKSAKVVCGGKKPAGEAYAAGNFFEPTILRDADHSMLVMREETFGPLVGVMPFQTLDEAVSLANDSPYGLAAIVYTKSLQTADRLARELEAGNVAINNVDAGVINAPYGGWKDSGFGHEHGTEGLYQYLHVKHIRIQTQ